MRTIRFTVWDRDDASGMPVHEKTFDVFDAALGHNALFVASQEAKAYRDGYCAGQGWRLSESWNEEGGGYHGRVNIPYSGNIDWSITLDQ